MYSKVIRLYISQFSRDPMDCSMSRFVIAFLPRSKHLLISWLQSPSAMVLEPKKIKSLTVTFFFFSDSFSLGVLSCSVMSDCDPMDWDPLVSSVHGISQARILEWVAISFSRRSSLSRDRTHVSCVSCIANGYFTHRAIFGRLIGYYKILRIVPCVI